MPEGTHRIVVVDFDARIGERLRAAFKPPEFDFHWFSEGREALQRLHDIRPDVIVCDVMLPDIDGRAVLDAVKRSDELRNVPFLVLSGIRAEATIRATLDAGAEAFLLKPLPVSQLLHTIRKVLEDASQRAARAEVGEGSSRSVDGLRLISRRNPERAAASQPMVRTIVQDSATSKEIPRQQSHEAVGMPPPKSPAVPAGRTSDAEPPRLDPGTQPRDAADGNTAPPISVEGRFSSLELDGTRVQITTGAESGRNFVVTTTVLRDGKELRKIETAWSHPLKRSEDMQSVKELIDLQHGNALEEISRLPLQAPRRRLVWERAGGPSEPPADTAGMNGSTHAPAGEPETLDRIAAASSSERGTQESGDADAGAAPTPASGALLEGGDVRLAPKKTISPAGDLENAHGESEPAMMADPDGDEGTVRRPRRRVLRPRRPQAGSADTVVLERVPQEAPAPPEPELPASTLAAPSPQPVLGKSVPRAVVALVILAVVGVLFDTPIEIPSPETPESETPSVTPSTADLPQPSSATELLKRVDNDPGRAPQVSRTQQSLDKIVEGRRQWAQALYEVGRYDEASAALAEVFKLAPSDPEARRIAAQLERAKHQDADYAKAKAMDGAKLGAPEPDARAAAEGASASKPADVANPVEVAQQDRWAVLALLARYEAAIERKDLAELKTVWPGVDEKTMSERLQSVRSWSLTLRPVDLQVTRDLAIVHCETSDELLTVDGETVQNRAKVKFIVRREEGSWIIDRIQ